MIPSRLRVLLGALLGAAITFAGATAAVAFSAQPGFSATTYATLPSGTSAGIAFIGSVMYSLDSAGGALYATTAAGTSTLVHAISGAPTGLAASGGYLYMTRGGPNDIVKVDPASGSILATVADSEAVAGTALTGIAADALGNLFVATTAGYIWAIPTVPAVGPPTLDTQLTGHPALYGIAVASDGSLYVAVTTGAANGIWQIKGPIGNRTAVGSIGPAFSGARGVGIIPGYVFVNNADGSISKLVVPGVGSGSDATALSAGLSGDLAVIGTDGCFYASQGATIVRLANVTGLCDLGNAAPPPPPPTLVLAHTSTNQPYIGNGDQSFTATLGNVASPGGVAVSFTVTRGASSTTYPAVTGPTGIASFSYAATAIGTDTITASAVINGTTLLSNVVDIAYTRALDLAIPTITYTVTGAHNTGPEFACPKPGVGIPGVVEYCGWYTVQPVLHWTVSANGPSGFVATCPDYVLLGNSPASGTPVTCYATNGDGKGSTSLTVYLQALVTPPTITASASTPMGAYAGGWTNQNVTVTFSCASDPSFGPTAISSCTAPVVVPDEGSAIVISGSGVDIAGTMVSMTVGPIKIDKTAPTIAVAATLPGGSAYTYGAWTTQDVKLTYSCADPGTASSGVASCPAATTISTTQAATTVTAIDTAGNTASAAIGAINIDRTPPTITATATALGAPYTGAAPASPPIVVTFTCGTDGAPVTCPAPIIYATAGTYTATGTAIDSAGNTATTSFGPFTVLPTQPSTLTIISGAFLTQGATTVSATLLTPGGVPIAGKTVTFTAGTASATAVTDGNGIAATSLTLASGVYALTATFAGDGAFFASTAAQPLLVAGRTQFVIWGGNALGVLPGQRVVFWGEKWWDQVSLPGASKVRDFKGWADTVNGSTWTTKTGNSKPPEAVPAYISVIISTSIGRVDGARGGDQAKISGNIVGHAILHVVPPYKEEPGKPVYGVVIAVIP